MGVDAALDLVVDRAQYQRAFHVAKGVFGAGQEHVGAPGVLSGQVVAVAVQQITAVQLLGLLVSLGVNGVDQPFVLAVVFDAVVSGDAGVALFDAADGFADFDGIFQPALLNAPLEADQVGQETLLLFFADGAVFFDPLGTDA